MMKFLGLLCVMILFGYTTVEELDGSDEANASAQQWLDVEAKVLETRTKIRRKYGYTFARVSFTARDGITYETEVKWVAFPVVTSGPSPKDTVSILYHSQNPEIAKSPLLYYLENYGGYLLIGAGFALSAFRLYRLTRSN